MKSFIPAILWGLAILILSTVGNVSPPDLMPNLLQPDKLAHAAAYGIFAVLVTWGFARSGRSFWQANSLSVLLCSVYGVAMEVVQYSFFPNRFFELWDIVADIIGCLASILVSFFIIK